MNIFKTFEIFNREYLGKLSANLVRLVHIDGNIFKEGAVIQAHINRQNEVQLTFFNNKAFNFVKNIWERNKHKMEL